MASLRDQKRQAKKRQIKDVTQVSFYIIACFLILSGILLDSVDYFFIIPEIIWEQAIITAKDLQVLGYALVALYICTYKNIRLKVLLFLLCVWKFIVLIINIFLFDKEFSMLTVLFLNAVYIFWLIRLTVLKKIKNIEPKNREAYFIFSEINSIKGLLQAVFLPWHPARYETRMVCYNNQVWSIYRRKFSKNVIDLTTLKSMKYIKVPIGRKLLESEQIYLDNLIGKTIIPGLRDCRKFLKVGK